MGKQIKGRCRRARENFPLSTGKFLKKNRPLPWRRIAYVEYPEYPLDIRHNSRTRQVSLPIIPMERGRRPLIMRSMHWQGWLSGSSEDVEKGSFICGVEKVPPTADGTSRCESGAEEMQGVDNRSIYSRSAPYLRRMSSLVIVSGTPWGMRTFLPRRITSSYASKMA